MHSAMQVLPPPPSPPTPPTSDADAIAGTHPMAGGAAAPTGMPGAAGAASPPRSPELKRHPGAAARRSLLPATPSAGSSGDHDACAGSGSGGSCSAREQGGGRLQAAAGARPGEYAHAQDLCSSADSACSQIEAEASAGGSVASGRGRSSEVFLTALRRECAAASAQPPHASASGASFSGGSCSRQGEGGEQEEEDEETFYNATEQMQAQSLPSLPSATNPMLTPGGLSVMVLAGTGGAGDDDSAALWSGACTNPMLTPEDSLPLERRRGGALEPTASLLQIISSIYGPRGEEVSGGSTARGVRTRTARSDEAAAAAAAAAAGHSLLAAGDLDRAGASIAGSDTDECRGASASGARDEGFAQDEQCVAPGAESPSEAAQAVRIGPDNGTQTAPGPGDEPGGGQQEAGTSGSRGLLGSLDAAAEARAALAAELGNYVAGLAAKEGCDSGEPLLDAAARDALLASARMLLAARASELRGLSGWAGPRTFDQLPAGQLDGGHPDPRVAEGLARVRALDERLRDATLAAILAAREADPAAAADEDRRRAERRAAALDKALAAERGRREHAARVARAVQGLDARAGPEPVFSYYKLEPEEEELLREVVGRDDTEMERDNPFDVLAPAPPASSAVSGVAHERLPGALGSGASAPTGGAAGSGGNDSVAWAAGGRGGAGPESWGGGGQLDVAGLRARLAEINAQLEAFGSMRDAHGGSCSEGGEGGGGSRRASMLSAAASLADSGASMLAQLCAPAPSERGSSMGGRAGGSGCGARRASGAGSSKDGCASDAPLGVSRRASCGVSRAGSSGGPKRGGLQGAPASSSRRGNDGGSLQGSSQHGGSQHEGGQPGGSMQGAAARGGADYLRELREVKEREARERDVDAALRALRAEAADAPALRLAPDQLNALLAGCLREQVGAPAGGGAASRGTVRGEPAVATGDGTSTGVC